MTAITLAIPTYGREQVLVDSIRYLLEMAPADSELLVVDQSPRHEDAVEAELKSWDDAGEIRWIRLEKPSITGAMNHALREAKSPIVLFLDDDIIPEPGLIEGHLAAHSSDLGELIAGRVIQPWQEGKDFSNDQTFHFATLKPRPAKLFIGANFSLRRDVALKLGGFDENFVRVAYNYEAEFSHRLLTAGYRIYFEPGATLHHLKSSAGGTRSYGEHLTTIRPDHAAGAYYFIMRTQKGAGRVGAIAKRMARSIATRHHLTHPWWIPGGLLAEIRGAAWALKLAKRGPRLMVLDDAE